MGVTKGELLPVEVPEPDPDWHPIARQMWDSLELSGQADWYQQSDWAFAWSLMDDLSYYKKGVKRSGQMLQSIYSALERLLVTEADRRRLRIELTEATPQAVDASVTAIADYKEALGL